MIILREYLNLSTAMETRNSLCKVWLHFCFLSYCDYSLFSLLWKLLELEAFWRNGQRLECRISVCPARKPYYLFWFPSKACRNWTCIWITGVLGVPDCQLLQTIRLYQANDYWVSYDCISSWLRYQTNQVTPCELLGWLQSLPSINLVQQKQYYYGTRPSVNVHNLTVL